MNRLCIIIFLVFVLISTIKAVAGDSQSEGLGKIPNGAGQFKADEKPRDSKIANNPACAEDVHRLCGEKTFNNNFEVLGCLQYDRKDDSDLSKGCEHFLWEYKRNLTLDYRFEAAANQLCGKILKDFPDCSAQEKGKGHVIPCLIDVMDNISDSMCHEYLRKMARLVFSDYRLIYKFADSCNSDIVNLKCGRIEDDDDNKAHSQGKTIECLAEHLDSLQESCRLQILRVAELQADDFNLDRPLYYACRDDREHFCPRTKAGGGRVYKCLFRHKFDREMSSACREKLTARQRLMQEDFKVNRPLFDSCREDVRQYKCMKGENLHGIARLSWILICLESVMKEGKEVAPECIAEMKDMRRSLMEDYKVSPNLVHACSYEITKSCGGGLHREGKTLHCLMDLARKAGKDPSVEMGSKCRRELEDLLEEANVGEDYDLDPVLRDACEPVAEQLCKDIKPGDGRIIDCLTDKLDSEKMTDECEEHLLEIQFFIQRDIKLDAQLLHFCLKDATEKCNLKLEPGSTNVEPGPTVFSCLYKRMKYATEPSEKLQPQCVTVLHHKMRQRAAAIDMEPDIQEKCLHDLSRYCADKHGKGQEMQCLQDHLEDLDDDCHDIIGNFTEDEADDLEMDKVLMKACSPMIKKFCGDLLENEDTEAGDIMDCLVAHKKHHEMNPACRAGVEHKQIISLKDFRFTQNLKKACKDDVIRLCRDARTKMDVLECLSKQIRDDAVNAKPFSVSATCRQQMRFEMLQREENIELDPALKTACFVDLQKFCSNISPGNSANLECLKKNQKSLSESCHVAVFKREREEAVDPNIDYLLVTNCKTMIKRFCADSSPEEMFDCLRSHKDEPSFELKCKGIVIERLRQKAHDYRLDIELVKRCQIDITKYCVKELGSGAKDIELEGKVIGCLRLKFAQRKLSESCTDHMSGIIKSSALDYQQDLGLSTNCKEEIKTYCLHDSVADADSNDDRGLVKECLKDKMLEGKITSPKCIAEIARVLSESRADVQVDPLLHKACIMDIKHYCFDVPPGEGKQMACLLTALEKRVKLQKPCYKMLSERVELWNYAVKVAPAENINDIYDEVMSSPARNYFLSVFVFSVLIIFIGGLCCGRFAKRIRRENKMK